MIDVFLLLGSNLGNRQLLLQQAIAHIGGRVAPVIKVSPVYETQSWGKTNLPDYLNQVIMLQTTLTAKQVLDRVLAIETELGRKREEKWGSRTIDIDILFYGDAVINQPDLVVPHPQLHHRRFTLEPLGMIAPDLIHPVLNKTILDLKNNLNDNLIVKKL
ncbi:2-amino-4-hydroxy-6-hydroxymethyldihydropteridine diphosphokinase [Mucilaginibacter phyllosphaerae]|uniref:2-amino-4-hydroxy-6-hydroxymethyldihydropteridine pyrophosphokinase n=1 Tax=Mucilaginibacter phyllosphaerae TaxID=1812349 RepID=A0A4Y8A8C4_9SPHI|nr:2-amino-4-hydroxy-6-hydroxymethyldihydropteridine diphosphokinase [Mucilaginibacter phyllosphaerae]MBB3970619.1 2-amino-4-hydroxy-6-hydroxymethyldihydropteridine diphosphokinase [Mucilaginibacter phyllosphaerae]TEW64626.1 2-amino-4-hydroxy-6-hydroxymethyldihydropteridine diphosphokinase [Mucilaginibacter phyllosphaerae]GGH19896.1 2-amino-4-hydroxy-6-hydroxymethyldihydropteridine diphosphokinase [Mucilaginibacter phyllosphaerae]